MTLSDYRVLLDISEDTYETISYNLDDFGEFQDEINDYLEEQGLIRKRKVSFL